MLTLPPILRNHATPFYPNAGQIKAIGEHGVASTQRKDITGILLRPSGTLTTQPTTLVLKLKILSLIHINPTISNLRGFFFRLHSKLLADGKKVGVFRKTTFHLMPILVDIVHQCLVNFHETHIHFPSRFL